jgi:PAS domain S-box-containing protein
MSETALNSSFESKSKPKLFIGSFTGWMALIFTVLTALFLIYYFFDIGGKDDVNLICDISQSVKSIAAFISVWHISRSKLLDDETKKAWRRLSYALLSFACGQNIWLYLNSIVGEPPFPSIADFAYIGFYPLMLWALRSFPTAPQTTTEKKKFWIDASTVMVSGFVVVYYFIIQPTIANGGEVLKIILNLIYVLGDMVLLLGIATILLKKPREYSKRALYVVILGLISGSISDINFAYFTLHDVIPVGTWGYAFFTVTSYFMILAAFFQHQSAAKHTSQNSVHIFQSKTFIWLPYIAIIIGYTMLLIVSAPYWAEPIGAFIFASLTISGLVVLRQFISTQENLQLIAEQMIIKNESKLRSMLANSSELTTIVDDKGNFEYISPAMEKVFGYDNQQLKGTNMYSLVHPDDKGRLIKSYYENSNDYSANIHIEYRFKHSNGNWHDMDGVAQLFFEDETKTNLVLMNARDVTNKKADEFRLREYTKKLQQSNRELQDFAFVASHDLQEPLRKVQAFGDRLVNNFSDKLGDDGLDYLRRMQGASSRMQTLINDLLTFSRVTTQAKPFVRNSLNQIVKDVLSDLEVKVEETKAKVSVENLPEFEMDSTQMRQLFQNLIGNGLKFSQPNTPPIIKIWSEVTEQSNQILDFTQIAESNFEFQNGFCQIYIKDNGIGFDEKYLDRIFTVFQRLHGRTEYEGSGVGLAVCRKIVERHHGYLTAKSKPKEGATFIITLPLSQTREGENK